MNVIYLGHPTIPEKENHLIYRYRWQKSMREASKTFYEVEFSTHKDCTIQEIWEKYRKEEIKHIRKTKQTLFSYCYLHRNDGFWQHVQIIPCGDKDESMPWWVRDEFMPEKMKTN